MTETTIKCIVAVRDEVEAILKNEDHDLTEEMQALLQTFLQDCDELMTL